MIPNQLKAIQYQENFSLKNKVAIVTGAAGYLGREIAYCLGQAGAHVILVGRTKDSLFDLQKVLNTYDIETTTLQTDITDSEQLKESINALQKQFSYVDILVNNAHSGRACYYEEATKEDFLRDYHVNVMATFELITLLRPLMKQAVSKNKDASIINVCSMYGTVSPDPRIYGNSKMNNPPHYGAAKAGLLQLSKYMACHLAPDKIRINAVSPGPFPPQSIAIENPEFYQKLIDKVPLERIGAPVELQGPILFLASRASSYITGINLPVDGGWTAW